MAATKRSDIEQQCLDIIRDAMDNLTSLGAINVIEANRKLTASLSAEQLNRYWTVLQGVAACPFGIEAPE